MQTSVHLWTANMVTAGFNPGSSDTYNLKVREARSILFSSILVKNLVRVNLYSLYSVIPSDTLSQLCSRISSFFCLFLSIKKFGRNSDRLSLDKITIKSLKFQGKHGYYDHERENGNDFEVDITARGNFKPSINNDDLELTFDYERAQEITADIIHGPSEKLIETLCLNIGNQLFEQFSQIQKLSVSLRKMNPPVKSPAKFAEITMKWKR